MNREKSIGKSISFFWAPKPYPFQWAESPDEVPPWDASRGFPADVGADVKRRPEPANPYEVSSLRPFLRDHVDYVDRVETWEPTPAPTKGYPRLIRKSVKMMPLPLYYRHEDDIVGALAPLAKYIQAWREDKPVKVLRNKILELAERYGPPNEAKENTLEVWLELITFVDVHLSALRDFKLYGYEGMLTELAYRCDELEKLKIVDEDATRRAFELAEKKYDPSKPPFNTPLPVMIQDLGSIQHSKWWYTRRLLWVYERLAKGNHSPQSYRTEVADDLFNSFSLLMKQNDWDYLIEFAPWGTILHCPIKPWVAFKLSELWRHEAPVEACPVCGMLFARTHGNQKYCRGGTCAGKAYELKRPKRS